MIFFNQTKHNHMKQTIHIYFIFFLIALTLVAACNRRNDQLDMRCPGPTTGESFVYNEVKTGSCGSSSSSSSGCDVSLIFSIPSDASNVFATLKMAGDFYYPSSDYATVKLNGTTFDIVSTEKQETTLRSPDGWSDKLLPTRFWTAGGTLTILLDASSSVSRWYSNGTYQPAASYEVTLFYVDYRFESSSISGNFTMSGDTNWQTDNESALGGASAARSGTLSSGQTSCMSLPVQNAGEVKFHQTVDSDSCEDYLSLYVNDVEQTDLRISGYKAWQGQKTTVTANSTLKWCYTRGSTSGSPYAWLDEIITPDNTSVSTYSPSSVSAGAYHTCAVLSGGTVKCWGYGNSGRLGNGSTSSQTTPVSVSSISTTTSVSGGASHTCAVLSGGTVKCWGYGSYGQLGNGSTTSSQTTPVSVSSISTATSVSAGDYHTCVVLSGGTVKCWGYGSYGQLGNGSTTSSQTTPVEVLGF